MRGKVVKMRTTQEVRQVGYNIPSNIHRAEDDFKCSDYAVGTEHYYVAAISDGCTSDFALRSDYGSIWLCEKFVELAHTELEKRQSEETLTEVMRKVVMGCIHAMASYRSQDAESNSKDYGGAELSEELTATLYAYISGPEETVLFLAGNGYVICNGEGYKIKQLGGDFYLMCLRWFPERLWEERFDEVFAVITLPTKDIRHLTVATDGLCEHMAEFLCKHGNRPEEAKAHTNTAHRKKCDDCNVKECDECNRKHPLIQLTDTSKGWDRVPMPSPDFRYCELMGDDATFVTIVRPGSGMPKVNLSVEINKLEAVDRDEVREASKRISSVATKSTRAKTVASGKKKTKKNEGVPQPAVAPEVVQVSATGPVETDDNVGDGDDQNIVVTLAEVTPQQPQSPPDALALVASLEERIKNSTPEEHKDILAEMKIMNKSLLLNAEEKREVGNTSAANAIKTAEMEKKSDGAVDAAPADG
jgi:hypothetical protein